MSWLDDLENILEGAGVGTKAVSIWSTSRAVIPVLASGLATVHLLDTSGSAPEFTQNEDPPAFIKPSAAVVCRADTYEAADTKAQAAKLALTKHNYVIAGKRYRSIRPINEPHDIGVDDRKQSRVSFDILGDRQS